MHYLSHAKYFTFSLYAITIPASSKASLVENPHWGCVALAITSSRNEIIELIESLQKISGICYPSATQSPVMLL